LRRQFTRGDYGFGFPDSPAIALAIDRWLFEHGQNFSRD
jgi:hypothetical protein